MAANLIEDAQFHQIDSVYTLNLPKEAQENVDTTVVLIQDVNSQPDIGGNETFYAYDTQVELQIFYKRDLDYDPEELEIPLLQLFKQNYWQINQVKSHVVDPDTYQVTATFYLSYSKLI
jgi:hypothetical protein